MSLEEFNRTLDDCLFQMEVLRNLHGKLKAAEKYFIDLSDEYQSSCDKLGIRQPLDLKIGLGQLAKAGSPWGLSFSTPDFLHFVQNLEGYRVALAGYEGFKAANPNFDKDLVEQAKKDSEQPGFQSWMPPSAKSF